VGDPRTWTAAIKGFWNRGRKSQLDEVKAVHCSYGERYSWSELCKHLIDKILKPFDGMNYIKDSSILLIKLVILKTCAA